MNANIDDVMICLPPTQYPSYAFLQVVGYILLPVILEAFFLSKFLKRPVLPCLKNAILLNLLFLSPVLIFVMVENFDLLEYAAKNLLGYVCFVATLILFMVACILGGRKISEEKNHSRGIILLAFIKLGSFVLTYIVMVAVNMLVPQIHSAFFTNEAMSHESVSP